MGDNYVPPRIVVGQHWHWFYHQHETSSLLLLLLLLLSLYHYMKNFCKLFDWLRAVVFQLNLKYLHMKITNLLQVVV